MRVLLDTDVLLDVALKRPEFYANSRRVFDWIESQGGEGAVAWHSLSNLAYLTTDARGFISDLLQFVDIAPTGMQEAVQALGLPMKDLEDAMQVSAAFSFGASHVITRNVRDYDGSPVRPISPAEFVQRYVDVEE